MRKIKFTIAVLFSSICFNIYADIAPEDYYYTDKCVQITNLDSFPELVFVGFISNVLGSDYNMLIPSNECLEIGYKHNSVNLLGVHADYMVGKDLEDINLPNDPHFLEANCEVEPVGYWVSDSTPISKITDYYKIIGFTETEIIMHKWKQVFSFYDNDQDSTAIYEYEGDTTSFYYEIPLNVDNPKENPKFSIYPNPIKDIINLKTTNVYTGLITINVYAINAELVYSQNCNITLQEQNIQFKKPEVPAGIYFIELSFGKGLKEVQKIIIE